MKNEHFFPRKQLAVFCVEYNTEMQQDAENSLGVNEWKIKTTQASFTPPKKQFVKRWNSIRVFDEFPLIFKVNLNFFRVFSVPVDNRNPTKIPEKFSLTSFSRLQGT